ncbi:MAG: M14 metallopeptidase family protein [Ginsengibacter sp.]
MKKIILSVLTLLFGAFTFAQVQSPEEFLGYKVGTRFTRHHELVSYFQQVAKEAPSLVKLQKYGETNEGRPLYIAFISTPENINNLEQIRMNNLRLANMAKDKMAPTENTPAIVWLSYNIHGNEASSSEASMLTLFSLVDSKNTQTKEWLKNTVVVIDPCMNPDGRDRYVNWYNTMVGKKYNPLMISREHDEPWPGGRSNHYNFDLNRDWAWQTQVESQQRLAQYNSWLPEVHVDFHEQSPNEPYYFAPAAQPYHEVITQWQSDFQKTIGRNHAKYFDKNGWLYFTNERFDLFYPSYGDTYPLYNGSIGMTYEQGGGGVGGLGVLTDEDDTLTLVDRAMHHYTTGISTIETASLNANKLITNFRKFFNDASAGNIGEYKTYIVKNNPQDAERIAALMKLLDKNRIQYGVGSGTGKGFSYFSRKEENFSIGAKDLLISAKQPQGTMVKVLFEPQSKLSDSITYDITAWALPYVYGLETYASKQVINVGGGKIMNDFTNNSTADSYGYVIRWQGVSSAKTTTQLLEKGIQLRFAQAGFEINQEKFNSGSIIIIKKGNEKFGASLWSTVAAICNKNQVSMIPVKTGMVDKGFDFGSDAVRPMKAVRVAMLTGEGVSSLGAGEIWDFFDNTLQYTLTLINATDFDAINLNDWDVIIMPDGRYRFLDNKQSAEKFHQWISQGGRVVAIERAVAQLSKQEWSALGEKSDSTKKDDKKEDASKENPYKSLKVYSEREKAYVSQGTPGAIFKVDVDNTHPLMFGYPKYYYTLKMDTKVYDFIKDGGWNVGVIKKENKMAGFVGSKLEPKLKDGLVFGVQDEGRGSVTFLSDDIMFRNFWENGKLMLCNAVFMVGQ